MPNIDQRFGLAPVRHLNGNAWNGQTQQCYIHSAYATALFIGDPVALSGTLAEKDTSAKRPTINKATAGNGNPIYGVITSFEPRRDTTLETTYSPASTTGIANVCIDPDVVYWIRDDGAAALTKVSPGQNANLIFTHGGSTVTGFSGVELDTNSDPPAADESNQLTILQMADVEDLTLAARSIWEVLINIHQLRPTAQGGTHDVGMLGVTAS